MINGIVNGLLEVRDRSNLLSEKIYAKLDEFGRELKAAGHVPTTEVVLFVIADKGKRNISFVTKLRS